MLDENRESPEEFGNKKKCGSWKREADKRV